MRIGITGSRGLIGAALRSVLVGRGVEVVGFDLRATAAERGDVRDSNAVERLARACDLLVHLAAVSRVVWGEKDPALCRATNVDGTRNVLLAALRCSPAPPVIVASSREVYGQASRFPVAEDAPMRPINVYGHTKAAAEMAVEDARRDGLRVLTLRFSNVYGSVDDHPDRVAVAFARAAACGGSLRVDGAGHTFDFCHLDDCVAGIVRAIDLLCSDAPPPGPIQLVTGRPTTLGELASLAVDAGGGRASIRPGPERDYDVAHFVGSPNRARRVLGWQAHVAVEQGLARLVKAFTQVRSVS